MSLSQENHIPRQDRSFCHEPIEIHSTRKITCVSRQAIMTRLLYVIKETGDFPTHYIVDNQRNLSTFRQRTECSVTPA